MPEYENVMDREERLLLGHLRCGLRLRSGKGRRGFAALRSAIAPEGQLSNWIHNCWARVHQQHAGLAAVAGNRHGTLSGGIVER
jgi:hypothetical protein